MVTIKHGAGCRLANLEVLPTDRGCTCRSVVVTDRLEAVRRGLESGNVIPPGATAEWLLSVVETADELAAACADENAQWADIAAALATYRQVRSQ